jgi:hypothetical protein
MEDVPCGDVWLGFRGDLDLDRLQRWIEAQVVLAAMKQLPAWPRAVFSAGRCAPCDRPA